MQAQKLLGTIFLLSLMCGPTMAQTYQPAGAEAGTRFAIDHDRVFPTTNGRVGAVLIEVPLTRRLDRLSYSVLGAQFDCERGLRFIQSRSDYSARLDPVTTEPDPVQQDSAETSTAAAEQLRLVCSPEQAGRRMTLDEFVNGRR